MRIIDWNTPDSIIDVFNNVSMNIDYLGEYDNCKSDWIGQVTNNFGSSIEAIESNLLKYFESNVDAIRCYHGTRLFFPGKIKREGLKLLSVDRIYKSCNQAKIFLNHEDKGKIRLEYNKSILHDEQRKHIYLNIDLNANMYQDGKINLRCSFFDGGEIFSNVLPNKIFSAFRSKLLSHGIPTIIIINLPFTEAFLPEEKRYELARYFFHCCFHMKKTDKTPYKLDIGIDIPKKIPAHCILKVKF